MTAAHIRRIAQFLASTYNGEAFPFDLFELRTVDVEITEAYAKGVDALAFDQPWPTIEALAAACHSLRGACGAVGATALHLELVQFEREVRTARDPAQHLRRSRAINRQLILLVERLKDALRS